MLQKKIHMKPGDRYRESKAKADAARLTEFLHKQTRLKGTVELIAAQPTERGADLPVYRISVGPEVLFETKGMKPKTVRSGAPRHARGAGLRRRPRPPVHRQKRRELQGKGYYRAKVDYSI